MIRYHQFSTWFEGNLGSGPQANLGLGWESSPDKELCKASLG